MSVILIIMCSIIGCLILLGLCGGGVFLTNTLVEKICTGNDYRVIARRKMICGVVLVIVHIVVVSAFIGFGWNYYNAHRDKIQNYKTNILENRLDSIMIPNNNVVENNTNSIIQEDVDIQYQKEEIIIQSIKVLRDEGKTTEEIKDILESKFLLDETKANELIVKSLD